MAALLTEALLALFLLLLVGLCCGEVDIEDGGEADAEDTRIGVLGDGGRRSGFLRDRSSGPEFTGGTGCRTEFLGH